MRFCGNRLKVRAFRGRRYNVAGRAPIADLDAEWAPLPLDE
jgi:hypothetical protein